MIPESITPQQNEVVTPSTCERRGNVMEAWPSESASELAERADRIKVLAAESKAIGTPEPTAEEQMAEQERKKQTALNLERLLSMIESAIMMTFMADIMDGGARWENAQEDLTQPVCPFCGYHHAP